MEWRKYQIDAVVETVMQKVQDKLSKVKEHLRASFTPTSKQEETLDNFEELKKLADQRQDIEDRINVLKTKINKSTKREINKEFFPWKVYNSTEVERAKEAYVECLINKSIGDIPTYEDVRRKLTLSTLSAGFDVEGWIEDFVDKVQIK